MNGPTLEGLFALFPPPEEMPDYEMIPGEEMPEPYKGLLVHEHHMTVTVEAYHGGPVDVRILARRQDDDVYARKILLVHQATGQIVQFGIVRIDLSKTSAAVRDAILAGDTPVGRILIEHDVLRRIEPTAFLRITPRPVQMARFGMTEPRPLYGRLAIIRLEGKPAVELLEVVAPA
jgi:chorismate-pyruvate lyase